jgi:uncharacterized protein (TIGR02147 family)
MTFRAQLQRELAERKSRNGRYSLRAFARLLGMSPGHLSQLLNGSRNLSPRRAAEISRRLGYDAQQALDFVARTQAASESLRRTIELLTEKERNDTAAPPLELETTDAISEWYHVAIVELTHCRGFRANPAWVARKLGISVENAEAAIEHLLRLGMLGRRIVRTRGFVTALDDVPSRAMRRLQSQMLEKAKRALLSHAADQRDITSLTIAIDPTQILEARAEIQKFRRRMAQLLSQGRPRSVYQLNLQFFRLQAEDTTE